MRVNSVFILTFFLGLNGFALQSAFAAAGTSHSHDGRVHTHILPKTGVKHYHKHRHNGRAHIHPYSAEVGFKHTHNKNKPAANAVKHEHNGRTHSHPLPPSGLNHPHKHQHGVRTHIHPLPANGLSHSHRAYKNPKIQANNNPPRIMGLSIKQQIAAVLRTPLPKESVKPKATAQQSRASTSVPSRMKARRNISALNQRTIDKVLGKHRQHRRTLKNTVTAKPVAASVALNKNLNRRKQIIRKPVTRTAVKKVTKAASKRIIKPVPRAFKQTPQQIAESNRQYSLALRYENGTGVERNLPQAFNWYQRSAKQGDNKAQYKLATLYEKGAGVVLNIPQSIRWYTTAANNGNANAQVKLGNKYAEGSNVPKDINKAKKWYGMAANQGDMRGRANLNYLIEE